VQKVRPRCLHAVGDFRDRPIKWWQSNFAQTTLVAIVTKTRDPPCMTAVQGQRSKVKVTRSRDVLTDKNVITLQCVVISTSNLVGIIDVGVDACGILSRPVAETNRK